MTNKLNKQQMCVLMRPGVEIWVDKERADKLRQILLNLKTNIFIDFEGRSFNTADITGVFTPQDLEDLKRRKNGQYKCQNGIWHERGEICNCKAEKERKDDIKKTKDLLNSGTAKFVKINS